MRKLIFGIQPLWGNVLLCLSVIGTLVSCTEKESKKIIERTLGMKMEMVYVEGGTFQMGGTAEQGSDAFIDERPIRNVWLDSYYIGKYEVTWAQWFAVMYDTICPKCYRNLPVSAVSWEEAQKFCEKLSLATGKTYVLPTEAQWEYAARGGVHKSNVKYAGSTIISDVAWYGIAPYTEEDNGPYPVGQKKPNKLGIYDMSGNVAEWCSDVYGTYDKDDTYNPIGASCLLCEEAARVVRGGSWRDRAVDCRVSSRNLEFLDQVNSEIGFRVVVLL